MVLTNELCDKLCASMRGKSEIRVLASALQSAMKTDFQGYIEYVAGRWR